MLVLTPIVIIIIIMLTFSRSLAKSTAQNLGGPLPVVGGYEMCVVDVHIQTTSFPPPRFRALLTFPPRAG